MLTESQLRELRVAAQTASVRRPMQLAELDPRIVLQLVDEIEHGRLMSLTFEKRLGSEQLEARGC